uniref:Uncharacterized protein n=1 Tax=Oryza glumipatula TaxID=40148 RepID=A0A0D9ZL06_9ORYZ
MVRLASVEAYGLLARSIFPIEHGILTHDGSGQTCGNGHTKEAVKDIAHERSNQRTWQSSPIREGKNDAHAAKTPCRAPPPPPDDP